MNVTRATEEEMEVLRDLGLLDGQDVLILSPEVQNHFSEAGISIDQVQDVASDFAYLTRGVTQVVQDESDLFASEVRNACLEGNPLNP